jgi:N-acetylglucosamine-6-phosphate deacetylase
MTRLALVGTRIEPPFGSLDDATLLVEDGRIVQVGPRAGVSVSDARRLEAGGLLAVPGFIDLHAHGALGVDYFGAPAGEIERVLEWLPSTGVTSLLPTTTSAAPEALLAAAATLGQLVGRRGPGARVLGLHLEGPWIAPGQRGAQLGTAIRPPDMEEFKRVQDAAGGHVRMVTLAPEQPGALALITHLADTAVIAAAGHTDATYAQVVQALERGLRHATHCFNAMRGLHHREPGVVGTVLGLDRLSADVILDGHHVDPVVGRILYNAKGARGLALITDAMQATGLGDGDYVRPGNRHVVVRDGVVRLESGALAGSVLTLDQAVRHAAAWFCLSFGNAAELANGLAVRLLGLDGRKGTLAVGADADICLLDRAGQVCVTVVGGTVAFQRDMTKASRGSEGGVHGSRPRAH